MKKLVSISIIAIVIFSCGGNDNKSIEDIIASGNLEEIRNKRAEIVKQQTIFAAQIQQLDEKIEVLDTEKKVPIISTLTIKDTIFNHYIELQGNVSTKNLLVIYPEFAGILTTVYVKEGQQVSKGETLAKIDDGGLTPQLAQLKIQANLAKTTFERQERLWEQKIGSEIQYL